MSKLLTFTATTTAFGPLNGFHMGSAKLVGTAASTATLLDGTATALILACIANGSDFWVSGDTNQGAVFTGQASLSVLTAGATLFIEEY